MYRQDFIKCSFYFLRQLLIIKTAPPKSMLSVPTNEFEQLNVFKPQVVNRIIVTVLHELFRHAPNRVEVLLGQ